MNDLENLRKRAKHLVRQHRSGSYAITERLRRALPRFVNLTDRELLDADFALHDAQRVIATELGFGSWADLKESPPMATSSTDNGQRFERALAQILVRNLETSLGFYHDLLGFEVVYTYGEPAFYAEVRRDDAAFNLRHTDRSPWNPDPTEPDMLAVAVRTTDAKSLFLEYARKGVSMHRRLHEEYGARAFIVRDPDGNLLLFGSSL